MGRDDPFSSHFEHLTALNTQEGSHGIGIDITLLRDALEASTIYVWQIRMRDGATHRTTPCRGDSHFATAGLRDQFLYRSIARLVLIANHISSLRFSGDRDMRDTRCLMSHT
jgi:hypothetical protein